MAFARRMLLPLSPNTGGFYGGHRYHPPQGRRNTIRSEGREPHLDQQRIDRPAPSAPSRPLQPKKLTREEFRDRSTKGLCWHCDEPWSHDHRCERGRLLLIEPLDNSKEEVHEHKEEVMEEEPQPADCMMHALASYANRQTMKVGLLKQ
ncbi:hypothetical protein B296_00035656 [Ensete ventricosum]|uniref:Uncharacterized protein n=1 Tax=Ensete ventricosum TaxID=4639 RepID=A0A426YM57_ENSVE|nr:hypothetical protein B296_00035656 [Ensete ventricosum]